MGCSVGYLEKAHNSEVRWGYLQRPELGEVPVVRVTVARPGVE